MGSLGKLAVVATGLGHALAGNIGWSFAALTGVDLIFAILFLGFLRAYPVSAAAEGREPIADLPA
jgi:hypothetical protein